MKLIGSRESLRSRRVVLVAFPEVQSLDVMGPLGAR
jgi:hypothetical protein